MDKETLNRIKSYKKTPELAQRLNGIVAETWAGIHDELNANIIAAANANKNGDAVSDYMAEVEIWIANWLAIPENKKLHELVKQYFADMIRYKAYQMIKGARGGRRRTRRRKGRRSSR